MPGAEGSPSGPAVESRARRFPLPALLRLAVTLGVSAYVLSRVDLSSIERVLGGSRTWLLLAAVGLYAIDRLIAAWRWQILYVAHGHALGVGRALDVYLQSGFLGAALPATVGQDLIRARLVGRDASGFAHAISSVVVERLSGTVAVAILAVAGLALFVPRDQWQAQAPLLGATVVLIGVGIAILLLPPIPASWGGTLRGPAAALVRFTRKVHEHLRSYRGRPRALRASFAIALFQQYWFTFVNWTLALALGLPVSLATMLWVWPIVMLAVRLPISILGFGVRELVLLGLLAPTGLDAGSAVSLGLLSGCLDLLYIGVGGVLLLAGRKG